MMMDKGQESAVKSPFEGVLQLGYLAVFSWKKVIVWIEMNEDD